MSSSATSARLKDIRNIVGLAAVEAVLFFSGVLTIFSPLPLIFAYVTKGPVRALWVTALAFGLILTFAQPFRSTGTARLSAIMGICTFISLTGLGLLVGHGLRARWNLSRLLTTPIVGLSGAAVLASLAYVWTRGGIAPVMSDLTVLAAAAQAHLQSLGQDLTGTGLEEWVQQKPEVLGQLFLLQLPLAVYWTLALATWIVIHTGIYYQLVREWKQSGQKALSIQASPISDASTLPEALKPWISLWKQTFLWRTPDWLIYPFLAIGAGSFLWKGTAHAAGLILFKCLATFYCFQAVSLIRYYLERWRLPGVVRLLMYFSFFLIPGEIGFFILVAFGVFDFWGDFRKKPVPGEAI